MTEPWPQTSLFNNEKDANQKFAEYDEKNPKIYTLFKMFANQAIDAGNVKVGAKGIMERIRWEALLHNMAGYEYKVNNNYTSRYARKFLSEYPNLKHIFETRTLKS